MSHHNVQQDDKHHKLTCLTITEWIRWSCTPQVDICLPLQNISFLWRLSNCFHNFFHWKQSVWLCDSRTMRNRGGQIFRKWEIRKDMKQMFKTDKQADTNKMRTLQHEDYSDCLMNVESKTSFSVHVVCKDVVTRTKSLGRREKLPVPGGQRHTRYGWPLTPPSLLAFMSVCHPSWLWPQWQVRQPQHNKIQRKERTGSASANGGGRHEAMSSVTTMRTLAEEEEAKISMGWRGESLCRDV